jgi:AcrR family transcriptional regulator
MGRERMDRDEISGSGPSRWSGGTGSAQDERGPGAVGRNELSLALAEVIGRKGYAEASIGEALERSECARAEFERHFADKEECFGAAQEILLERALDEVGGGFERPGPWLARVCEGLVRTVELCVSQPNLARAMLVCPAAAGAAAQGRALEALEHFAELIEPVPELPEHLPPRATMMAVSGVAGLIGDQLAHGEAAGLAEQLPELTFALLVPLLGPAEASQQMGRVALAARG